MILAAMMAKGKNALLCDFAETYHIYDLWQLPIKTVAALAVGLRDNSRIKMLLSGQKYDAETILLSAIADRLAILIWQQTKDGHKNQNRPKSILEEMDKEDDAVVFASIEEYEAARKQWES